MAHGDPPRRTWLGWVNVAAGAWLILSPFVLGYADAGAALANDVVVGALIVVLAGVALVGTRHR